MTHTENTNRQHPGTWALYFDLRGTDSDTDGALNPAWRDAAESFVVTQGDYYRTWGTAQRVVTWVAVHTVDGDTGQHRGRDAHGRAVLLIPVTTDEGDDGGEDDAAPPKPSELRRLRAGWNGGDR